LEILETTGVAEIRVLISGLNSASMFRVLTLDVLDQSAEKERASCELSFGLPNMMHR